MESCEVCAAQVGELRRGRCWGCYGRWAQARPVGVGAACCMCGDRRRGFLRTAELLGTFVPICHACSSRATALSPMPQTLAEVRGLLRRERRASPRRIGAKVDDRVFPRDRRGIERRGRRARAVDVAVNVAVDVEQIAPPLHESFDAAELTRIRENPLMPRRAS